MEKYIAAIDENYTQIGQRFDKFRKLHLDNGGEKVTEFAQFSNNNKPLGDYTNTLKAMIKEGRTADAYNRNSIYDKFYCTDKVNA